MAAEVIDRLKGGENRKGTPRPNSVYRFGLTAILPPMRARKVRTIRSVTAELDKLPRRNLEDFGQFAGCLHTHRTDAPFHIGNVMTGNATEHFT